ncbi:uridine kinase [Elusimicrobiota bacterium]
MTRSKSETFLIGIAGGSGSGKTTFADKICRACSKVGIEGQIISLDNYYRPLDHLTFEKRQVYNFDHPNAIDSDMAYDHIKALRSGKNIEQPLYDFKLHTRQKEIVTRHPTSFIVVEGLYALYFPKLLSQYDLKIFVSTGLATGVLRRVQRDVEERGRDIEGAKHQILNTVLPMYETYVKPTQKSTHFSINWDGEEVPQKATEGLVMMLRDHFRQSKKAKAL